LNEGAADPPKPKPPGYVLETLTGKHSWTTEEGAVFMEVAGQTVLICESLDSETTSRLEHELLPSDPAGKAQ
jgi:hypothetical protein